MLVNLVKQSPPELLEARLKNGKFISKEQVVQESQSSQRMTDPSS